VASEAGSAVRCGLDEPARLHRQRQRRSCPRTKFGTLPRRRGASLEKARADQRDFRDAVIGSSRTIGVRGSSSLMCLISRIDRFPERFLVRGSGQLN
jgi:hypothetical protein